MLDFVGLVVIVVALALFFLANLALSVLVALVILGLLLIAFDRGYFGRRGGPAA
jgi:hypothetical protein